MFDEQRRNYYDILDITPEATQAQIRQAYFRVKAAYSKDSAALYSLFDKEETKNILNAIEEAYLVLSTPNQRKEYDKTHGFITPNSTEPGGESQFFSFSQSNQSPSDRPHSAANIAKDLFGESGHFDEITGMGAGTSNQGVSSEGEQKPSIEFPKYEFRKIDLNRPYDKNPETEAAIQAEQDFSGAFLQSIRKYRNLSLEDLADYTKISKSYLKAIEEENFAQLPAAAYVRGFISQYAKALKLSSDQVANAYMKRFRSDRR